MESVSHTVESVYTRRCALVGPPERRRQAPRRPRRRRVLGALRRRQLPSKTLNRCFSAAATNWESEVGKKVEVKGDWWVGGTSAERRKWHMVTVIEYKGRHEFDVVRKGQPTTQRIGKALKIRVDAVDDSSEDAWMDVNQYAKYKERFLQKVKDDAIVENARTLLKGALSTDADDDDGNGAGGGDGSPPAAPVRNRLNFNDAFCSKLTASPPPPPPRARSIAIDRYRARALVRSCARALVRSCARALVRRCARDLGTIPSVGNSLPTPPPPTRAIDRDRSLSRSCARALVRSCARALVRSCARALVRSCAPR